MLKDLFKFNSKTASLLLILFIGILYLASGMRNILHWDTMGYNSYLPLIFKEHSFVSSYDYFVTIYERYDFISTLYQYVHLPDGTVFIKYTMGWALFYSPFYLIADCWAGNSDYIQDGFSYPYQLMALIGSFFYFALTVIVVRKMLKLYFNEKTVIWLLFIFVIGTNFFHLCLVHVGITHNLMVLLVTLFVLQTHRFHNNVTLWNAILLGAVVGSMGLVRTPSIVIALFAIFFNYSNYGKSIFSKILYFLKNHFLLVAVALLSCALVYLPQIMYWKTTTGSYFLNSYANNPGEGMDWARPYFLNVLFSFRNGWLIYTPIMAFALFGFVIWIRKDKANGIGALLTFLIFFYVVSCWTCWWYANTFGHRAMIDIYPILLIAMGFFIERFSNWKFKAIFMLLIAFNLFQTYQERLRILDGSLLTKEAYFSQLFQVTPATDEQKKLYILNAGRYADKLINVDGFEPLKTFELSLDSFALSPANQYSPYIRFKPKEIKDAWYLLVRTTFSYAGDSLGLDGKIFTANAFYKENSYNWKGSKINDQSVLHDAKAKTVTYTYFVPHLRSKHDKVNVGLWAQDGDTLLLTHLKVDIYEWNPYGSLRD